MVASARWHEAEDGARVAAEAARLAAAVRAGRLSLAALQLAAHLGDGAARATLGAAAVDAPDGPAAAEPGPLAGAEAPATCPRAARLALCDWAVGLGAFGPRAWLRVAYLAASLAHADWARRAPDDHRPAILLGALSRHLAAPTDATRRELARALALAGPTGIDFAASAALETARAALLTEPGASLYHAVAALADAAWVLGPGAVRAAVRDGLVPELLGRRRGAGSARVASAA